MRKRRECRGPVDASRSHRRESAWRFSELMSPRLPLGATLMAALFACDRGEAFTGPTLGHAPMLAAGNASACALLQTGTVRCWGAAVWGTPRTPPFAVDSTV